MRERLLEGCRFLGTGLWATILDVAVLAALSTYTTIDRQICFVLAFSTSVLCRFFVDRYFTFRLRDSWNFRRVAGELCRYLLCCLLTMLVGVAVFEAGVRYLSLSPLLAKLVSIPPVTISGYLLFRCVAFKLVKNRT